MGERGFLRGRAGGKYGRAAAGACAAYFKKWIWLGSYGTLLVNVLFELYSCDSSDTCVNVWLEDRHQDPAI